MSDHEILGIDIGGSGIKAAPVNIVTGEFLDDPVKGKTPYPAGPEELAAAINRIATDLRWSASIGVGYPGIVKNGVAMLAAHHS